MVKKILMVDDDESMLAIYQECLHHQFNVVTASSGQQALALLRSQEPFAIVVADMHMPEMDGLELLTLVQQEAPDAVRFMLTGDSESKTAIAAVNTGHIFQFLTKPIRPPVLVTALELGLQQHRLITAEHELLEKTLNGSIKVLTELLSMAEPQLSRPNLKLREYAQTLVEALEVRDRWEVEIAAMLRYIGYMTIPDPVLQKVRNGATLKSMERDMLTRAPEIGHALLAKIPRMESVARIILYSTKHFDGSGFPGDAVVGVDIPPGSRILKVAEDLIELEASGLNKGKIIEELKSREGWYDCRVIEAAITCLIDAPPKGSTPVPLNELCVGQVLMAAIETTDGTLLVAEGNRLTDSWLEKIRNFSKLNRVKEPIYVAA